MGAATKGGGTHDIVCMPVVKDHPRRHGLHALLRVGHARQLARKRISRVLAHLLRVPHTHCPLQLSKQVQTTVWPQRRAGL